MTIAFWCVLVAALLPYVPFGLVRGLDPKVPRAGDEIWLAARLARNGRHLNAFEAFPPFAAAVIISHLCLGANRWTNLLALVFLLARFAHMGAYLADQQPPRSLAFFVGIVIVIVMFAHAAWG